MIFFLYGPDSYRSHQKVRAIHDKFFHEVDPTGINIVTLDGGSTDAAEIRNAIQAGGFFAAKRLVIIRRLLSDGKKDLQTAVLELLDNDRDDVIMVFWEPDQPDKRTALYKRLSKEKYSQVFESLDDGQLRDWVQTAVTERQATINPPAVHELVRRVGPDLWRMEQEIAKLAHFRPDQPIDVAAVQTLVTDTYDDNIFHFVDALADRNAKAVLQLIDDQLAAGAKEQYLLAMIIRQFRILLQLAAGSSAKELGLHSFVAQKAQRQVRKFTPAELRQIYQRLLHIDRQTKSGGASFAVLFDLTVVQSIMATS